MASSPDFLACARPTWKQALDHAQRWLVGGCLLVLAGCAKDSGPKPRHVVVFVLDTLRADHLASYGYSRQTSPILDALAKRGARFDRALAQSSWTGSSMVSMFSSKYVAEDRLHLPGDVTTLPEVFKKSGWHTAAFVANDILNAEHGFERGFDRFNKVLTYEEAQYQPIVEWLSGLGSEKSFTWIHLIEPHDDQGDYGPPYVAHDDPKSFRNASGVLSQERLGFLQTFAAQQGLDNVDQELEAIEGHIAGYDDDVHDVDRRIGQFLQVLSKTGQLDHTLIAVASDHGEGLWTREAYWTGQREKAMREGKPRTLRNSLMQTHGTQVHRELLHVPLLLSGPGIEAGSVISAPVENMDLAPTLVDLAGLTRPRDWQGHSLVPVLRGETVPERVQFSHTNYASSVVTKEGLQLILPTEEGRCKEGLDTQLYDWKTDPDCRHNLAAERPADVERLTKLCRERLGQGLRGLGIRLSPNSEAALKALGYAEVIPMTPHPPLEQIGKMDTNLLLDLMEEPGTTCLLKVELARELRKRTLLEEDRLRMQRLLSGEPSERVKEQLRQVVFGEAPVKSG